MTAQELIAQLYRVPPDSPIAARVYTDSHPLAKPHPATIRRTTTRTDKSGSVVTLEVVLRKVKP